jgi:hypothetical protein
MVRGRRRTRKQRTGKIAMTILFIVLLILTVASLVWSAFALRGYADSHFNFELFNPWLLAPITGAQAIILVVRVCIPFGWLSSMNLLFALLFFAVTSVALLWHISKKTSLAVGTGAIALLELAGVATIAVGVLFVVAFLIWLILRGPVYRLRDV